MVDAGTFIYYNAYEVAALYQKTPEAVTYHSLRGETSSFRGTTRIQSISGSLYGYNVNQRANLPFYS